MTIKPTLQLKPHHLFNDILSRFFNAKPLDSDQLNFLIWHEKDLSSTIADPLSNYYLKKYHLTNNDILSVGPHEKLNKEAILNLQKRIKQELAAQRSQKRAVPTYAIKMTFDQYIDFKLALQQSYGIPELIYWHGNHFLSGDSFYPGGIPYILYYQWGNLFGIVKYVVLPGEKALKGNILIYFEDMQDRLIDQCIADYNQRLRDEIIHQNQLILSDAPKPSLQKEVSITIPSIRLTR